MAQPPLQFLDVTFLYDTAAAPVIASLTVQFGTGWTGVVGPNGCGKSTLLRLACGELEPTRGAVRRLGDVVYCPQRTDDPPAELAEFLAASEARACALRGRLGVRADWRARWSTLSHGERKRAQLGVALWREPGVLALDEPTNHIDGATRAMLAGALHGFRGTGLLVSHDRALLDALCRQCLMMAPGAGVLRPGGYTRARELAQAEERRARELRAGAAAELQRLEREASHRRREAARADKLRSKRHLDRHDHDGKAAIDRAVVTSKDAVAGRKLRQLEGRIAQAAARAAALTARPVEKLGVTLAGARAPRAVLARVPAGELPLGVARKLVFPELVLDADARVALVGPNGAGKSTLVRHTLARLNVPAERVVYLPQELSAAQAGMLAAEVRRLPRAARGAALSNISRLGSAPEAVLETTTPSPGEARKILLAMGMSREPYLIVMDEPTNHLDLPSIECLEAALERFLAALLLVSHDEQFLRRLTRTRWQIEADGDAAEVQHVVVRERASHDASLAL